MRKTIAFAALAALSLAACQKQGEAPQVAPAADAAAAPAAADGPAARSAVRPPLSIPQLAYSYRYALAAPPDSVRGLIGKHEAMCWAAGPQVCQVTGADVREDARNDRISATLSLRAQPDWLRTFRLRLEDDTKAVGGRVVTAGTETDDLSRALVDTEAALKAKTVLRDRLQETLRTRPGKATDFFEMEQQLARVQGEIDATRSELAMMRTRVAASELTIEYRSEGVLAPRGLDPIGKAVDDVFGLAVMTLAVLIRLAAVAAPIAGLGALGWWLARRNRKPRRAAGEA